MNAVAEFARIRDSGDFARILANSATVVLQPWIHGFALQGEDAEDTFMDSAQRFFADKTLQTLDAKCEFAKRQRPLVPQAAVAQPCSSHLSFHSGTRSMVAA